MAANKIEFDVRVEVTPGDSPSRADHFRVSTGSTRIIDCYESGLTPAQRATLKELLSGNAEECKKFGEGL